MMPNPKNTNRLIFASVLLCSIFLLAGCGSLSYMITSDPSGAQILVDGRPHGTTPGSVTRPAGKSVTVSVKKEGYEPASIVLKPDVFDDVFFMLEKTENAPVSFVKTMEPTWASVQIREGLEYENAWNAVMDVLVRKFDLEVLSKDNGYMRTSWLYAWTGQLREDYRVRVTIKFNPERNKVDVKSEANYQSKNGWTLGSDTALLQTIKTDLMGTVGRITR